MQMVEKNIKIDEDKLNHQYAYRIVKRIFDVIASAIALVLLSPLFLVLAIFIKIDDPNGPVFYTQTRVGKDGKTFQIIKFRSI